MKECFKSLDEVFNLPAQDYSLWKELDEGIDCIRNETKPSGLKKSSLKIEKKSKILKIKNKDTEKVLYEDKNNSYGLKNYYNLVDELIFELLDEQHFIMKYRIDGKISEKKEEPKTHKLLDSSYKDFNNIFKKENVNYNKLKNLKVT
jgi:hypothetical protein